MNICVCLLILTKFQNHLLKYFNSNIKNKDLDLADCVTLDLMAPILANKNIQEKLVQYLPDSEILPKNENELRMTLSTPQFKKVKKKVSD